MSPENFNYFLVKESPKNLQEGINKTVRKISTHSQVFDSEIPKLFDISLSLLILSLLFRYLYKLIFLSYNLSYC